MAAADRAAVRAALRAEAGQPVVLPVVHVRTAQQAAREAAIAARAGCSGVELIGQRRECYAPGDANTLRRLNAQLFLQLDGLAKAVPAEQAAAAELLIHSGSVAAEDFYRTEGQMISGLVSLGVTRNRAAAIARLQRKRGDVLIRYSLDLEAMKDAVIAVRRAVGDEPVVCVNWWGRTLPDAADALLLPLMRQGVRVDAYHADAHQAALGTAAAGPSGVITAAAAALRTESMSRFGRPFLYFAGCASKGVGGIEAPGGEAAAAIEAALLTPVTADAVVTSGAGTGRAAGVEKLAALRRVAGSRVCVGVASGVTPDNVGDCVRAGIDVIFVASGVMRDWFRIDEEKLALLLQELRKASAAAKL
eukprot:TRINITY_DN35511_c0_g1_i1.p1 TRINITY_DN35511_c0_g1~~TRINITY_DN35511_c0_g1_i1.p1  ORF type:complete len:362 (+),score=116.71 TRINITY_DN35511_c0_g1_i1:41-1126(+)